MKITITGPRSVGKTTVSKALSKRLDLNYYSSDDIGEENLKEYGGLDKAIKSKKIDGWIKQSSYGLIREIYEKNNFVFDLSGGAFSSRKFSEASRKVRKVAKENSIVIGLLPSKNIKESIELLFKREKNRAHFKEMGRKELYKKVEGDYKKFPSLFREFCDFIIYINDKTPEQIYEEIKRKIPSNEPRLLIK